MNHKATVLKAAQRYTRWGWRVVPVPYKEKGPHLKGWQKLRLEKSELPDYFDGEQNIGVLLGKVSGGLVDVDLDCPEALFVGSVFLSYTGRVHGRESMPSSHYWFRARPTPAPEKFHDIDGTSLVELRSTGQQTIVPPSVHPSGERLRWESRKSSALVEAQELRMEIARVAAASLFARHWPEKGRRNETALALAGMLLRAEWQVMEVTDFVATVAKAAHDEEWEARKAVAYTTRRRLVKDREATGRPRLSQLLGEKVVDRACEWLGIESRPVISIEAPQDRAWPKPMSERAFYGLAGDVVKAIESETEADRHALLLQLLVGFGSIIGRGPYYNVERTDHQANLFAIVVGNTSKARKGTSWSNIRFLLEATDRVWAKRCLQSGLSSGEGLIWEVRDPIEKETGKKGETEVVDAGVHDKRRLVYESEFARVLKVMRRDANILATVLCQAFDGDKLQTMTKNSPAKATRAHISVVAHITVDALRRELTEADQANGFANRFLFCCVRRSKKLPFGGKVDPGALRGLIEKLQEANDFASKVTEVRLSKVARGLWIKEYDNLSEDVPGMFGAMTARAEALVRRLALVYALLDRSNIVKGAHLRAALAVWAYCRASVRCIFGDALGDVIADTILNKLRMAPEGLTRTEIYHVFSGNVQQYKIESALVLLVKLELARCERVKSDAKGRPTERWLANT